MNVAAGESLRGSDSRVANLGEGNACGWDLHDGEKNTSPGAVIDSYNFQDQWKRPFELTALCVGDRLERMDRQQVQRLRRAAVFRPVWSERRELLWVRYSA